MVTTHVLLTVWKVLSISFLVDKIGAKTGNERIADECVKIKWKLDK